MEDTPSLQKDGGGVHIAVKARSTQTNLVTFVDHISLILDKRGQVVCLYTDFTKAFDKVNHHLLIYKLECYGVRGLLLKCLLMERSEWAPVTSSVPKDPC